jgi:hypothetical protein
MIGLDSGTIPVVWVVAAGLVIFGFVYNQIYGWLEREGYSEGYLALVVAGGVLVTLLGVMAIEVRAGLLALGAFVCSGFWMVIGAWWRHVRRRAKGQRSHEREFRE